jgi:hypothetical protein
VNPIDQYESLVEATRAIFFRSLVPVRTGRAISSTLDFLTAQSEVRISNPDETFSASDHLPLCSQLRELLVQTALNASSKAKTGIPDPWGVSKDQSSRVWIHASETTTAAGKFLILQFQNRYVGADLKPETPKLDEGFLQGIGGDVLIGLRDVAEHADRNYSVTISIPYLSTMRLLERKHGY